VGNTIIGGECMGEEEYVTDLNKFHLQSCKRQKKITKMMKRINDVLVAATATV
jgi:uncharacterized C2H2 Zn-finger protein